ncbi:hypothetical protein CQW23_05018 [Capsicum baccatum]|uniref:Integrase catalytic domain-containing protein n=1 Tax=Capsicum baccatum TaxID=33114 RepID=A0A2G2XGB3_CAPBA|nr:hypothetical protein CQW23_05018 [Capsicum baccatum]
MGSPIRFRENEFPSKTNENHPTMYEIVQFIRRFAGLIHWDEPTHSFLEALRFSSSYHYVEYVKKGRIELNLSWFESDLAWGMDVIGPIEPKVPNGHRFILVAIDYFRKFGIQKMIITNNTGNINSHLMQEVCQQFKIAHRNSTPDHLKANGTVEAANNNIKKILRKMVQGSRQWHEKLSFALLGYQTTVLTLIGATPYLLVYRTEPVIPAAVEIPSL